MSQVKLPSDFFFLLTKAVGEVVGEEKIVSNQISDEEITFNQSLLDKIYRAPSGEVILTRTGKQIGKTIEDREGLDRYFGNQSLGNLEVENLDGEKMLAKIKGSSEAFEEGEASCPFSTGLFIGFYSNFIDEADTVEHIVGEEKKCVAKGDESCEFEIRPTLDEFTSFYS